MSKSLILLLCGVVTDALPACAPARNEHEPNATDNLFFVVHGVDVNAAGADLCQATTTSPAALSALCRATAGCAGFTLGTLGRPGSVLKRRADSEVRSAYAGMDLYVRGQAPAANISAVHSRGAHL